MTSAAQEHGSVAVASPPAGLLAPFRRPPQRTWTLSVAVAAAALAAAAAGTVALAGGAAREQTTALAAVSLVSALSFVGSGLAAWRARPVPWTGTLMIAAGFALFAGSLAQSDSALPFTIGLVVGGLPIAILGHLLLAFPDGHLHSRRERGLIAAAYAVAVGVQVPMLMFMGFGHVTGCPCPRNLLFLADDHGVHAALMSTQRALGVALAIAISVIVLRRWRAASAPLRRAVAPLVGAGSLTLLLLGAMLLTYQASTPVGTSFQTAERIALALVPLAYVVGLFRARLAHAGVGDLLVELGSAPEPGRLRDALAATLGDPSLELAYWIDDAQGYVGVDGRPVDLGARDGRTVTALDRNGRRVAALVHDAALAEDPRLLGAVSSAAGLALENERLLADVRAQLEALRESRARLVTAGDAERRRLERNLHDGAQQRLVALSVGLGLAERQVDADPAAARELIAASREELGLALGELREIARGLHPAILTDHGLKAALRALADRAPLPVDLDVALETRAPAPIEAAAYYVVAEALTNVAKYAHATRAHVRVRANGARLRLEVADDGIGGADRSAGTGLRGLDDRVQAFGGRLEVDSPPGRGTRIVAELPLP